MSAKQAFQHGFGIVERIPASAFVQSLQQYEFLFPALILNSGGRLVGKIGIL